MLEFNEKRKKNRKKFHETTKNQLIRDFSQIDVYKLSKW